MTIGGRYWDVAEDDYIFLNDIQILDTQAASTFAADWTVSHGSKSPGSNPYQHACSSFLSPHWQAFLNNEYLSDITINVGGKIVHAHRVRML